MPAACLAAARAATADSGSRLHVEVSLHANTSEPAGNGGSFFRKCSRATPPLRAAGISRRSPFHAVPPPSSSLPRLLLRAAAPVLHPLRPVADAAAHGSEWSLAGRSALDHPPRSQPEGRRAALPVVARASRASSSLWPPRWCATSCSASCWRSARRTAGPPSGACSPGRWRPPCSWCSSSGGLRNRCRGIKPFPPRRHLLDYG